LHPEVKLVGFLTLLYAGTTLLKKFRYSIEHDTVKKLNLWSKSAGNIVNKVDGTSETLRNGIVVESEHVKHISDHVPKHLKPLNDDQLGHYLAGLIDGDGHLSKIQQLIIIFSSPDAFLAYYLKEKLGYGNVRKVKNKKAYILVISKKKGILKVIKLINGKLRIESKYNQVVDNILNHEKFKNSNITHEREFTMNTSTDFNNHWLAGFSDADASFQIKTIKRATKIRPEIRLNYQIDQKKDLLLKEIKTYFGGNIGYRKSQDTYYYGSTSFGSARKVIQYFDKYHLQSRKHISYLRWRKVYLLIQKKEHLTEKGLIKIERIKSLLNVHKNDINNTSIQDEVLTKI